MANFFYQIAGDDFIEDELDTQTHEVDDDDEAEMSMGFQIEDGEIETE